MNTIFKITFAGLFLILFGINGTAQVKQQKIARVDQMPNLPQPFQIIDYKKLAIRFDSTVLSMISVLKVNIGQWYGVNSSDIDHPTPI
ncbi:MAG: hypothetical protein Q7T12_02285 [Flavobacterium sp.]|nr:hypothetical protein [Flavobacterium sp.]